MKKNCTTKNRIKAEQKKDMFQKQKFQNQKFSTPMNLQQNHNALTTQKIRRFVFQRCQNLRNIQ